MKKIEIGGTKEQALESRKLFTFFARAFVAGSFASLGACAALFVSGAELLAWKMMSAGLLCLFLAAVSLGGKAVVEIRLEQLKKEAL